MSPQKTLFIPIVDDAKLHPKFVAVRSQPASAPTRWMLDHVFQTFDDPDGNFVEQFQTTGFDHRYFELYLYAYFSRSGFAVDRSHPNPDFIVARDGLKVAVEATTVNPATSGVLAQLGTKIADLEPSELLEYQREELAIRFGSPLFTKLNKRYWERPQCIDLPFVIAIEAFHDEESLGVTDYALSRYVFALDHTAEWCDDGKLVVSASGVAEHVLGTKRVSSGFFNQPDTEHVSAVVFTNSGTNAKFSRMGFQHGVGNDSITIIRRGNSYNPDPDAMDPTFFSYDLDYPPMVETWGQGVMVLHNPRAIYPLPRDYFPDAVQGYIEDGMMKTDVNGWHPMASKTLVIDLHEGKDQLRQIPYRTPCFAIGAISRSEFGAMTSLTYDGSPTLIADGWFSDETSSFFGVLLKNLAGDWAYEIVARDPYFRFKVVQRKSAIAGRQPAREALQYDMAALLHNPKRIFE